MNLGFFLQSNSGTPQNTKIFKFLNDAMESKKLNDASVFFNDTGFNPLSVKFGMFNSADIWNFKGNLICTSIENLRRAFSAVNDIKIAYLFSSDEDVEKNLFDLVGISKSVRVVVDNPVDQHTFYRLTGKKPLLVEDWSVDKVGEVFDE